MFPVTRASSYSKTKLGLLYTVAHEKNPYSSNGIRHLQVSNSWSFVAASREADYMEGGGVKDYMLVHISCMSCSWPVGLI